MFVAISPWTSLICDSSLVLPCLSRPWLSLLKNTGQAFTDCSSVWVSRLEVIDLWQETHRTGAVAFSMHPGRGSVLGPSVTPATADLNHLAMVASARHQCCEVFVSPFVK